MPPPAVVLPDPASGIFPAEVRVPLLPGISVAVSVTYTVVSVTYTALSVTYTAVSVTYTVVSVTYTVVSVTYTANC